MPNMTQPTLLVDSSEGVMTLTLNRPDKLNAIDNGAAQALLDAIDVVVAASSSRFKFPEASLGVFVTGGLSATLPAYAGLSRAKALTLLGDEFTPEQACAWGLVWLENEAQRSLGQNAGERR
jgi:enoyl-CoA hydratase/carnithine racemase